MLEMTYSGGSIPGPGVRFPRLVVDLLKLAWLTSDLDTDRAESGLESKLVQDAARDKL